jgi:esterase/lipase superfamily enzyme
MKILTQFVLIAAWGMMTLLFQGCKKSEDMSSSVPVAATNSLPAVNSSAGDVYKVWFGTNRKPTGQDANRSFSVERLTSTTYGRVNVFIPKAHRFGETGNPLWKRALRGDLRDDNLRIQETAVLNHDPFYNEIRQAIKSAVDEGNGSQALVFIHGFNVTFQEAAIRSAQIGVDLKVPGPTAFFSWPSLGSAALSAYRSDEKSILASESAITDFLVDFSQRCGASNINLIAHSMGNRGLLYSLQRIATNAEFRTHIKFNQIFLAAPDVGRDEFVKVAHLYSQFAKRTTLYTSNGDLPVYLSSVIHDGPRAGFFKPYTVAPGLDTIAVPDFDIDMLGHSYFAQAEALLNDIHDVIVYGEPPRKRQRISQANENGIGFWNLGR